MSTLGEFDPSHPPQPDGSGELESPCTHICVIHPRTGFCVGCLRTAEEIAQWTLYSNEERQQVWGRLADRRPEDTS